MPDRSSGRPTTILFPVNLLGHAGAEQQLLALVRGLDKRRYRPIVAPLYHGGFGNETFRCVAGAEVVDLNRTGKFDFSVLGRMASLLRSRRVDIIQPFLTPATFFGLLPALLVNTPIRIATERCGVRLVRGVGNRLYQRLEDELTRYADAAVANSHAGRDLLIHRGINAEKTHVIYNGLNRERLRVDRSSVAEHRARLGVPESGAVVGILAALTAAKGHDTFLRAAAALSSRRTDVRYAVIGWGPLRTSLEELAVQLGLADKVIFFGYQMQVADYLAACDVIVSSSRDNEGCSNSILETMALNVPVVATDVGGTCELVEDRVTGYVVPVDDHEGIGAAIEDILTKPGEARAIADRARTMVDTRFSLQGMVKQYEMLYDELLASKRGAPFTLEDDVSYTTMKAGQ
ncbi:MAG: glycosyltransferase [Chloroflexi bacterium]|nr:glycosyltransferase [Chloroflexota bacterium]